MVHTDNPMKPPPYTINQESNNSATSDTYTGDNESNNLLSREHSNYGSVPVPREPKTSHTIVKLLTPLLTMATYLFIMVIILYPFNQQAHDKIRRKWDAEEREHQVLRDAWNSERNAMAVEREQWRKEQVDHENRQRQEEEEKRSFIIWENLTPSKKCLRYATREYSATLTHVPIGLDPLKECRKKSIDIHGRRILPSRCDTQGMCGAVTGHWIVDFNEATCVTWWNGYYDKGCVERGIHRYESGLVNLQGGDDWKEMCATTPGNVQGKDFDGPTSCATWWPSGVHGIWLIEDVNCL